LLCVVVLALGVVAQESFLEQEMEHNGKALEMETGEMMVDQEAEIEGEVEVEGEAEVEGEGEGPHYKPIIRYGRGHPRRRYREPNSYHEIRTRLARHYKSPHSHSEKTCTKAPRKLTYEDVCHDVQEWINKNSYKRRGGGYGIRRSSCKSKNLKALSVAKSILRADDTCYLDWPSPDHLTVLTELDAEVEKVDKLEAEADVDVYADAEADVEAYADADADAYAEGEAYAEADVEAEAGVEAEVEVGAMAIKMCRDDFIHRIEDYLKCPVPRIDYCHNPSRWYRFPRRLSSSRVRYVIVH